MTSGKDGFKQRLSQMTPVEMTDTVMAQLPLALLRDAYSIHLILWGIEIGCNVNAMSEGATLLTRASRLCLSEVIDPLINAGAEIDKCDKNGNTPLMHVFRSVSGFYTETEHTAAIVEKLVSAGADIHRKNTMGVTPLDEALSSPCLATVRALIDNSPQLTLVGLDLSRSENRDVVLYLEGIRTTRLKTNVENAIILQSPITARPPALRMKRKPRGVRP